MKSKWLKLACIGLATCVALPFAAACSPEQALSNEDRALKITSGDFDGVFNPFFATSAYDSTIVGQTQISMIGADDEGVNVTYGVNEPVVTLDYKETMYTASGAETPDGNQADKTVYQFVIKNGIHLKRYSFHSKVVLTTTAALILVGWAMFMAFEWNNPATIADKDVGTKLLATLFMSISPRTAGFNTVSSKYLSGAGGMLSIVLMFIGGSPGSTAGGIKTTTLAVLVMSAISTSRRRAEAHIFNRRFEDDAYPQAGTVFSIYITAVILSSMIICALECDNPAVANVADGSVNIHYVVFEVVSAIGTVGLSCGITGAVGAASQLILIFLMFLGRVGGFTLILVFTNERKPVTISRVAGNLIIG